MSRRQTILDTQDVPMRHVGMVPLTTPQCLMSPSVYDGKRTKVRFIRSSVLGTNSTLYEVSIRILFHLIDPSLTVSNTMKFSHKFWSNGVHPIVRKTSDFSYTYLDSRIFITTDVEPPRNLQYKRNWKITLMVKPFRTSYLE